MHGQRASRPLSQDDQGLDAHFSVGGHAQTWNSCRAIRSYAQNFSSRLKEGRRGQVSRLKEGFRAPNIHKPAAHPAWSMVMDITVKRSFPRLRRNEATKPSRSWSCLAYKKSTPEPDLDLEARALQQNTDRFMFCTTSTFYLVVFDLNWSM